MKSIDRVAVVGCGTIGASWATLFLACGLDVAATDPDAAAEARLRRLVDAAWPALESAGMVAQGASRRRLSFSKDLANALDGADFVQESGPERVEGKRALYAAMDQAAAADIVLASSTSGLKMSDIQTACRFSERCVVGHPFNPPHLVPLVEIVPGRLTSPETVAMAEGFYRRLGKHPIVLKKEVTGHIANRLQAAVWREAVHLYLEGVAGIGDIDTALSAGPGMRWPLMGPSLTFHLGGGEGGIAQFLDHLAGPVQSWWDDLGAPDLTPEVRATLRDAIEGDVSQFDMPELTAARDGFLLELRALLDASRKAMGSPA